MKNDCQSGRRNEDRASADASPLTQLLEQARLHPIVRSALLLLSRRIDTGDCADDELSDASDPAQARSNLADWVLNVTKSGDSRSEFTQNAAALSVALLAAGHALDEN